MLICLLTHTILVLYTICISSFAKHIHGMLPYAIVSTIPAPALNINTIVLHCRTCTLLIYCLTLYTSSCVSITIVCNTHTNICGDSPNAKNHLNHSRSHG